MTLIQKAAFLICPFGGENQKYLEDYWTNKFEFFYKPFFLKELNLNLQRSKALPGDLVDSIIVELINSDVVIADITDYNPNVLWELGIRHSFKYGTIIIAEKGTEIPFDLKKIGVIFYPHDCYENNPETRVFLETLKKSIKKILSNPKHPDSPVIIGNTGRGSIFTLYFKDEILRKINAIIAEANFNRITLKMILRTAAKNKKQIDDLAKEILKVETTISKIKTKTPGKIALQKKLSALKKDFLTKQDRLGSTLSNRMVMSSIETLISNRYLDETERFYYECLCYHEYLLETNDTLGSWHFKKQVMGDWLIENVPSMLKQITKIKRLLNASKKNLEKL